MVAVGLIVLLVLVGANKKLRQKVEALLLERLVKNKIRDLEDKAAQVTAAAEAEEMSAKAAEETATELKQEISKQKEALQSKLELRGMNADEISTRFNRLRI